MSSSGTTRRFLVSFLLLAAAITGVAVATQAATHSDQATCWPHKPGCDQ